MQKENGFGAAASAQLEGDEVEGVLAGAFYSEERGRARAKALGATPRPDHYKVICIRMYNDDLSALDAKVDELKKRGFTPTRLNLLIKKPLKTRITLLLPCTIKIQMTSSAVTRLKKQIR